MVTAISSPRFVFTFAILIVVSLYLRESLVPSSGPACVELYFRLPGFRYVERARENFDGIEGSEAVPLYAVARLYSGFRHRCVSLRFVLGLLYLPGGQVLLVLFWRRVVFFSSHDGVSITWNHPERNSTKVPKLG